MEYRGNRLSYPHITKIKTFTLKHFTHNNNNKSYYTSHRVKYKDPAFQTQFKGPILQKDFHINNILIKHFHNKYNNKLLHISPHLHKQTTFNNNNNNKVMLSVKSNVPKAIFINANNYQLDNKCSHKVNKNCFNEIFKLNEQAVYNSNPFLVKYGDRYFSNENYNRSYYTLSTKGGSFVVNSNNINNHNSNSNSNISTYFSNKNELTKSSNKNSQTNIKCIFKRIYISNPTNYKDNNDKSISSANNSLPKIKCITTYTTKS